MRSAMSLTKLHTSMPSTQERSVHGIGACLKRSEPFEKGCAAKPKPPASLTALTMSAASIPVWSIGESRPKAR